MVGHQRRGPALERLGDRLGQLGVPKVAYGATAHGAAEQQHRVVDAGQLVEHAGERGRHRRVGVDDGAGVEALVDAEVQVELGGRLELALDQRAVAVDDRDLLGLELGEHGPGRRDRDQLAGGGADVAGGAEHEALGGEPAAAAATARRSLRSLIGRPRGVPRGPC